MLLLARRLRKATVSHVMCLFIRLSARNDSVGTGWIFMKSEMPSSQTVQPESYPPPSQIYTAWFKTMDSILYIYIYWTIHGMWMIYITFERGGPNFQIASLDRSPNAQPCSSVSWEQNGNYAPQDFLCSWVHQNWVGDCRAACVSSSFQHSASNEEEHLSLESPIWANRLSV